METIQAMFQALQSSETLSPLTDSYKVLSSQSWLWHGFQSHKSPIVDLDHL